MLFKTLQLKLVTLALSTCLAFLLTGCGANHNSIFRASTLPESGSKVILIDAKQRAIISTMISESNLPDDKKKRLVMCAEASPDVFSVYASALAAGAKVDKSADPSSLGVEGNFSYSSAETGSTIPRTATLTMLREMMYRTCERYLIGAISALELPVQAARDQRVMIAALAIEGLTGSLRTPAVILNAGGTANSGSNSSSSAEQLTAARNDVKKTEGEEAKKKKALDDLDASAPKCGAKEIDDAANAAKKKSCEQAGSEYSSAKAATTDAKKHYDNMNAAIESGSIPTSASTQGSGKAEAQQSQLNAEAVKAVADAVGNIVNKNYDQPEFLFFCLKLFSKDFPKSDNKAIDVQSALYDTCLTFVSAGIQFETANFSEKAAERVKLLNVINSQFDSFWSKVSSSASATNPDATKMADLIKLVAGAGPIDSDLKKLADAKSKIEAQKAFGDLTDQMRVSLSRAGG